MIQIWKSQITGSQGVIYRPVSVPAMPAFPAILPSFPHAPEAIIIIVIIVFGMHENLNGTFNS